MKIIFLDIDGVLNGYGLWTEIIIKLCELFHLREFFISHYDIFGVRENMVRNLSKIVKATGAKIVISSSWRNCWYNYDADNKRQVALHTLLNKYGIEVIGITPHLSSGRRGEEILQWLAKHEDEVDKFVILDDERFDIEDLFRDQLVQTSEKERITGNWRERTGLKRKHVRAAIIILNG